MASGRIDSLSLGTRVALGVAVLIGLTSLGMMALLASYQRDSFIADRQVLLAAMARFDEVRLQRQVDELRTDLLFLSKVPPTQGVVRATRNGGIDPHDGNSLDNWTRRLEEIFAAFATTNPHYSRIRFIGLADAGRELLRVERRDGRVAIVASGQRQGHAAPAYVLAAGKLKADQVHLTDVVREAVAGAEPPAEALLLRAAAPVFADDRTPFGVLVIDLDFRQVLKGLAPGKIDDISVGASDATGTWVARSSAARDDDLDSARRWQNEFTGLSASPATTSETAPPLQRISSADGPVYAVAHKIAIDSRQAGHELLLVYSFPADAADALIAGARERMLAGITVSSLLILLLVLVLVRRTFAPLTRLTEATQAIAGGRYDAPLPKGGAGELGSLVQSFRAMQESVAVRNALDRAIVETSTDGFWMTDTEGRILDVNQAYAKLSGYTREELLTMRALDLKADGDQEEVRRNLAEIALRGSHRFEATHRRKDGSVWPVEYTASYLPINGGRLFAFLRDIGERKQQEEQVNRLLTENQTILGNALVGIVYLRHRRIVSCNRRLEEIFQYEPGELIGESTERFYDSRETYDHIGIVAYRDGAESKGYTGDVRLRHKDGSLFWGTLSGRAIDPAHPQEGSIWVYTDITERKLAESANQRDREQQEALRRMLEIALDNSGVESALTRMLDLLLSVSWLALLPRGGIFLSDEDGEGLRLAAARNLDPAVQASCTRVPYGLCHCGRAAASGEIQYAPRVDARHEITHAGMTNHGHYCIPIVSETRKLGVLMLYLPVDTARDPYAEGFLESVAGILASYLLRSEAEQALLDHRQSLEESVRLRTAALHMSEARSRAILGTMLDGVVHIDPDGTMLTVNNAILGMFGYEEDELLGRNVRMLMPEPYASAHDGYLRGYERTRQSTIVGRRREVEALRKDGSRFPIELAVNEMIDDDGNTFIGLIRDMTAQKADERELQDALRTAQAATQAKGRFLANMSHEVRTPLNAVLGLAQIGMRNSAGSPAGIAFGRIADAGEHLLAVVNDILDFSKIEAGKLKIERQPFALHATTDRLVSFMADRAEAKGLTLTVTLAPDLPKWVAGDELRVAQILTNLVSNAIKFTASGEVSLRVACEGDDTWFMVSDTGIGMDESQLARLFRPFEQADGSTTRNYGGTGLGLAISLDLARLMGGDIEVESRPGMGSTFTLYLPLPAAEAPERSTAPSLEEGATLSGLLILAADDVEINRLVLEDLLMHEGAQVVFATNGLQAVERLERDGADAFDLVLMDVQMPVMDGIEATRRIRAMAPLLPVLGLTAHALAEEREKCMDAGMVDVATKPINLKSLVAAIRRQVPPGRQRRPHSGEPVAAAAPRPRSGIDGRQSEATESESAPARPIPSGTFSVPPMGPAGTAVDWQALLARYDGREDFIIKLAASVFGHHADTPAQLRAAVEQGDRSSLIFTTHSLKGIGGNIEARRLHQLAKSMEANLRAGQDIDRERVAELVTELETVLAELVIWNQQKGST